MISVITPIHEKYAQYVRDAYKSLCSQSVSWEWVLVVNHPGVMLEDFLTEMQRDKRVRVMRFEAETIGALKKYGAEVSAGEIIAELDADDILTPDALYEVEKAFEDSDVGMVYSNSAEFREGTWESQGYSEYWGWRRRDFEWEGHKLVEMVAWEPSPHMMRQIFWAPNHIRAWRRSSYMEVGGHDPSLYVGDDHNLCVRFYVRYGAKGLRHIDKCLYIYRRHDTNTCVVDNDQVQKVSMDNYIKYSRSMATRWSRDNGLRLLDLGGRFNAWEGYETVDMIGADVILNLELPWEIEDNSVGVIRAKDIFEHLHNPIHTMNEAYRVLAPGGWLFIDVPSTDGKGAYQDPTHVSFWNENSFWYYTDERWARFIRPQFTGRFQKSRIITWFPGEFEKKNDIPYVQADLICLKSPYSDRPVGEVLI